MNSAINANKNQKFSRPTFYVNNFFVADSLGLFYKNRCGESKKGKLNSFIVCESLMVIPLLRLLLWCVTCRSSIDNHATSPIFYIPISDMPNNEKVMRVVRRDFRTLFLPNHTHFIGIARITLYHKITILKNMRLNQLIKETFRCTHFIS